MVKVNSRGQNNEEVEITAEVRIAAQVKVNSRGQDNIRGQGKPGEVDVKTRGQGTCKRQRLM